MYRLLLIGLLLVAFWLRLVDLDSQPPGVSNDEAVNVVDAFHISRTGNFPLYEDFGRPEPLYRLFLAFGVFLLGPGVWTCRCVSVLFGLVTVALAQWAMRCCLPDLDPRARRLAGFAAAGALAVTLSHVALSRAVYRGIVQPPVLFLFMGFLLRGLERGRRRDFVLAGLWLGILMYTYTAALILPLSLAAVGLGLLLFRSRTWRTWLPSLIVLGVVFAVLIIPVGLRLLTYPNTVLGRTAAVSGDLGWDWGRRLGGLVTQFFTRGDVNPQYNVESAPLLLPGFDVLFVLGLLALLARLRQPSSALIAALLVLAAIPVLASDEIPHGLRIMGEFAVFPPIVGAGVGSMAAFGLMVLGRCRAVPSHNWLMAVALLLLTVLIGSDAIYARQTYAAYWDQPYTWRVHGRDLQHGEWFFRPDRREFARWLSAQQGPLLVPLEELNMPTTRAWLLRAYPDVATAGDSFVFPADTRIVVPWSLELGDLRRATRHYALLQDGAITLLPPLSTEAHVALLENIDSAEAIRRANGDLLARVGDLPDGLTLAFEPPLRAEGGAALASFGGEMALLAWRGPDTLREDSQSLTYTLDWSALRHLGHYYSAFLQLQTQTGERIAGDDVELWRWLYPTSVWRVGDVVPDVHTLEIPADLPPGAYRLVTGVYPVAGGWLPAVSPGGDPLGDAATIGWVKVPQRDVLPAGRNVLAVDAILGNRFALRAASATSLDDGRVRLVLEWESLVRRPAIDATIFVHVAGTDRQNVTQDDARPWNGQYPTFIWDAGERVRTEHLLDLQGATAGDLHVFVGMYTLPEVSRLPVVQNGEPASDARVSLGSLDALLQDR